MMEGSSLSKLATEFNIHDMNYLNSLPAKWEYQVADELHGKEFDDFFIKEIEQIKNNSKGAQAYLNSPAAALHRLMDMLGERNYSAIKNIGNKFNQIVNIDANLLKINVVQEVISTDHIGSLSR